MCLLKSSTSSLVLVPTGRHLRPSQEGAVVLGCRNELLLIFPPPSMSLSQRGTTVDGEVVWGLGNHRQGCFPSGLSLSLPSHLPLVAHLLPRGSREIWGDHEFVQDHWKFWPKGSTWETIPQHPPGSPSTSGTAW